VHTGDLPVACADDFPSVTVAAHGHCARGNLPLVALAVHANFLHDIATAVHTIHPSNVALATHAGKLPAVALSVRGHCKLGDSSVVALAACASYSPKVALTLHTGNLLVPALTAHTSDSDKDTIPMIREAEFKKYVHMQ
jgi:hypothetical protein